MNRKIMRKGITDIRCAGFLVGVFHSRKHLKKSVLVNVYGVLAVQLQL